MKFNNVSSANILATSIVDQPTSKLQGFWRFQPLSFRAILDFNQPLTSSTQHTTHATPLTFKSRDIQTQLWGFSATSWVLGFHHLEEQRPVPRGSSLRRHVADHDTAGGSPGESRPGRVGSGTTRSDAKRPRRDNKKIMDPWDNYTSTHG